MSSPSTPPRQGARRPRRAVWRLMFTLLALLSTTLASVPATSAAPGDPNTISGTVTAESDGSPLAGIVVAAIGVSSGVYNATTLADGTYEISGVPAGDYEVMFSDSTNGVYAQEWWDSEFDIGELTVVTVGAGAGPIGIDASMVVGATVSGTVTADVDGSPLEGILVLAEGPNRIGLSVETAADGSYSLFALAPGSYTVRFRDNVNGDYAQEYWNDTPDIATATTIAVTAGAAIAGVDAGLGPAATVSGTVTVGIDDSPRAGTTVFVENDSGFFYDVSAADGSYTVRGLPPGTFVVEFSDPNYPTQWWSRAFDEPSADTISLTAGQALTGIDEALGFVPSLVEGTVTSDLDGSALSGIDVWAESTDGLDFRATTTGNDGSFSFADLFGDYTFRFFGDGVSHAGEYWIDKADKASADIVTVVEGDELTIDASLAAVVTLSGTVTYAADGSLLDFVDVCLLDESGSFVNSALTGFDGTYQFSNVADGTYIVQFGCGMGPFQEQYWDGQSDFLSATSLEISGSSVSGVDAALVDALVVVDPGSISGTVTTGGNPLDSITVFGQCNLNCDYSSGLAGFFQTSSATDGTYAASGLAPGEWAVWFSDPTGGYVDEIYDDIPGSFFTAIGNAPATPVVVASGSATTGIDADLEVGGVIVGEVTGPLGLPVAFRSVRACSSAAAGVCGFGSTGASGHYEITGLPAGAHTVEVLFGSAPPSKSAIVQAPGSTTVDLQFTVGGRISGSVTDASGDPIAGLNIAVQDPLQFFFGNAVTAADGTYTTGLLPAGDYSVNFGQVEFYDDEPFVNVFPPPGDLVTVTDAVLVSDIDAELDVSYIEGTVTSNGVPLPNVSVQAFGAGGFFTATTGVDGSYRMVAQPGTYDVSFFASFHVGQSLPGVVLSASADTTGVDADLAEIPPVVAPPAGTTVTGGNGSINGVPSIGLDDVLDLTHAGCANGSVTVSVTDLYGGFVQAAMSESPAGSGSFVATVDILAAGLGGQVAVSIFEDCPDGVNDATTNFNVYIDPAGTIVDQRGNLIDGATVTLMRDNPDTVQIDFEAVPDGSAVMDPSINTKNPDITGSDGAFRWDVVAGLWKVRATAPGCHAPGDASTPYAETENLVVPPPRLGLVIELECEPVCPSAGSTTPFTDVAASSFARSDIACIFELGVTTGTSATTYAPGDSVTREQMASFLARLYASITGEQAPVVSTPFTDVSASSFARDDIGRIFGLGITTGTSATTYAPSDSVTREQMASFLARLYAKASLDGAAPVVSTPFTDVSASSFARDDIGRIFGLGITTGASATTYAPGDDVTREQMASFLARLYRAAF